MMIVRMMIIGTDGNKYNNKNGTMIIIYNTSCIKKDRGSDSGRDRCQVQKYRETLVMESKFTFYCYVPVISYVLNAFSHS